MNAQESQQKFQQADGLFRAGQYQAALGVLDELNRAFPNEKNILYPAALCLEKLGRARDALNLCEQLIAQHQDRRAQEIKNRLTTAQAPYGAEDTSLAALGLQGAADILDMDPPRSAPAYKPVESESEWKKWVLIGLGVAVLLAILIIPPLIYEAPPDAPGPASRPEQITRENFAQTIGLGFFALIMVASIVGYTAGGYVALMLMNQLPSDDFGSNVISVGGIAILVSLLGFIPLIGPIISLVIISKTYDLGCGGLIGFVVCAGFGGVVFALIPTMIMLGSLGAMAPA